MWHEEVWMWQERQWARGGDGVDGMGVKFRQLVYCIRSYMAC